MASGVSAISGEKPYWAVSTTRFSKFSTKSRRRESRFATEDLARLALVGITLIPHEEIDRS
jgi:hypothetical protein